MISKKENRGNLKFNLIYEMTYRILTLITPLITSPYISRVLGAKCLGEYSFTLSVVNYFTMIAYLGIDNYGCKMIAKKRDDSKNKEIIFWEIYYLQLLTGIIAIVLYFLYCIFFVKKNLILFCIQGFAIIAALLDINWYFAGTEQFKLTVIRNIIIKICTVVSIFTFVKNQNDLVIYAMIIVLGNVISQIVMWNYLFKDIKFRKINIFKSLKHMKPNISLFIPVIAVTVYHTMDKTMLGILSDYSNVGYYYNADKVISMPLGLITALGTVMLPRMANIISTRGLEEGKILLSKSFELNLFLSCSISFGIFSVSNEFVPLFFGNGYDSCIPLIKLFAPVLVIKSLSSLIQTQLLIPNNDERIYTISTFTGAFVNLILNFSLIPNYGALGATIGTFGAELVVLLMESMFIIKTFNIFKLLWKFSIYLFAAFIMVIGIKFVSDLFFISNLKKILVEIIFGGFIYLIVLIPYWFFDKDSIFNVYFQKIKK